MLAISQSEALRARRQIPTSEILRGVQLKDYRQRNPEQRQQQKLPLSDEFDRLFSQVTGYDDLDHRLALTRQKKPYLLLVLDFPEVPLDNNEAERALREYVVKRKISNGARTLGWNSSLGNFSGSGRYLSQTGSELLHQDQLTEI